MLCRETISFCKLCLPRRASAEGSALFEQIRTGRAVDCAVYAASPEQRPVRSIDDCVNGSCGDVASNDRDLGHMNMPNISFWMRREKMQGLCRLAGIHSWSNSGKFTIPLPMSMPAAVRVRQAARDAPHRLRLVFLLFLANGQASSGSHVFS